MAHVQYPRQVGVCTKGTAFYKCAVGPFTGCCSTNPCDTGVCGDIERCDTTSLPAKSQTLSTTMPEGRTTTLTVTVSEVITSLTATVTISDVITSLVTGPAATIPAWDSLISDMTTS